MENQAKTNPEIVEIHQTGWSYTAVWTEGNVGNCLALFDLAHVNQYKKDLTDRDYVYWRREMRGESVADIYVLSPPIKTKN